MIEIHIYLCFDTSSQQILVDISIGTIHPEIGTCHHVDKAAVNKDCRGSFVHFDDVTHVSLETGDRTVRYSAPDPLSTPGSQLTLRDS